VLHLEIYLNATPKEALRGSGAAAQRRGIQQFSITFEDTK
jgi:hypothetical protein